MFDLDNTGSPTSSSPANRWVSYRLHVTPLGASTKVELEADGQAPQTAMVTDADCGGGPDPGTLHLNLGVHYEATTHTTYSDDVEVSY